MLLKLRSINVFVSGFLGLLIAYLFFYAFESVVGQYAVIVFVTVYLLEIFLSIFFFNYLEQEKLDEFGYRLFENASAAFMFILGSMIAIIAASLVSVQLDLVPRDSGGSFVHYFAAMFYLSLCLYSFLTWVAVSILYTIGQSFRRRPSQG